MPESDDKDGELTYDFNSHAWKKDLTEEYSGIDIDIKQGDPKPYHAGMRSIKVVCSMCGTTRVCLAIARAGKADFNICHTCIDTLYYQFEKDDDGIYIG